MLHACRNAFQLKPLVPGVHPNDLDFGSYVSFRLWFPFRCNKYWLRSLRGFDSSVASFIRQSVHSLKSTLSAMADSEIFKLMITAAVIFILLSIAIT